MNFPFDLALFSVFIYLQHAISLSETCTFLFELSEWMVCVCVIKTSIIIVIIIIIIVVLSFCCHCCFFLFLRCHDWIPSSLVSFMFSICVRVWACMCVTVVIFFHFIFSAMLLWFLAARMFRYAPSVNATKNRRRNKDAQFIHKMWYTTFEHKANQ